MKKQDFFYELPEDRIAQEPVEPRDHSRMLVLDRKTGTFEDRHFYDVLDYLREGDCLVLNDSRVLPARLYGEKCGTGAAVELLLLHPKGGDRWEALAGPGRRAKPGDRLRFGEGLLEAEVIEILEGGNRLVQFDFQGNFYAVLEQVGQMPLPHYIKTQLQDKERYQTVYAREPGSAAAPTAGLHFTPALLDRIRAKGVDIAFVTLHVGLGTFRPVKADDITDHKMHAEHYELSQETADRLNRTRAVSYTHLVGTLFTGRPPARVLQRGKEGRGRHGTMGNPPGRCTGAEAFLPRLRMRTAVCLEWQIPHERQWAPSRCLADL